MFSLIFRLFIAMPILWNILSLMIDNNKLLAVHSAPKDESLEWYTKRKQELCMIFILNIVVGLIHYYFGTKWSSYLNNSYFYLNHFTALTTFSHNMLPILEEFYFKNGKSIINDYWTLTNWIFFVYFFYVYFLENAGFKFFSVGRIMWFYGIMVYLILQIGELGIESSKLDKKKSFRNTLVSVLFIAAHV